MMTGRWKSQRTETARLASALTALTALTAPTSLLALLALLSVACAGCAGYQVGADTLFRKDVRTVHVPIFQSDSLRRHLGERLTEAVTRKIDSMSAYRLAAANEADSVLSGRILYDRKAVIAENRFDTPRALEAKLVVQIEWLDRNGLPLTQLNSVVIPDSLVSIAHAENFIPEPGQSLETAHQKAIERLADEIVSQMEARW
ncbi:MAG: hypothetical protein KDB14_27955 [Planctomycetales bacterium]|nr:hypothetical protein [Planctomycetales bacterium]